MHQRILDLVAKAVQPSGSAAPQRGSERRCKRCDPDPLRLRQWAVVQDDDLSMG